MSHVLSRRSLLRAMAGTAGAFLVARPTGALATRLPSLDNYGTPRQSRLFPDQFVVHADMHNHSLFSDGAGDPENFYVLMRDTGLDAAALTDHSTFSQGLPESPCAIFEAFSSDAHAECLSVAGLTDRTWAETNALADRHDAADRFAAIAGFEWSSPTLGHMNVWFSRDFSDPAHTGGLGDPDDLAAFAAAEGFPLSPEVIDALRAIVEATPAAGTGMAGWHQWLRAEPGTPVTGGGADGIFGFNHPGREAGRFGEFVFDQQLIDRCVSMELFNKNDDFLFELVDQGRPSPLVACLDAGWRPGLLGTSDYHGEDWGTPDDRGRAGMYVTSLSRTSIRQAMEQRRFYATRLKGLRFDATANGARPGTTMGHTNGIMRFAVDIDRGPAWYGKRLNIQVLATGSTLPTVLDNVEVVVPTSKEPVIRFQVPVDVEETPWIVLRVTDPDKPAEGNAPDDLWRSFGRGIAYASPFHLDPEAPLPDEGLLGITL